MFNHSLSRSLPLVLVCAAALFGCEGRSPMIPVDQEPELPRALSRSETLLVEAGNDFSFHLMSSLFQADPSGNLFISPLSASMALGMTLNGAQGATADQIREVFGFGTLSREEINQGYRDLLALLEELDPTVELGTANSVWTQAGFPVRSDFLSRSREYFDAEVQELDLQHPDALGVINGWVAEATDGRIEKLLDQIEPATVSLLLNATHFQGTWSHEFPKSATATADFTQEGGVKRNVQMMRLSDDVHFGETGLYHVVDVPYGIGAFSMTVFLPKPGHTVAEVVTALKAKPWSQVMDALQETPQTVYLPRFSLEWKGALNQALQGMGMLDAFLPGIADLSALSELPGLYVNQALQRSWVAVDEEGTGAAAATSVDIQLGTSAVFRADHPFVFVIGERLTRTILFAGAFMTPTGT